MSAKDVFFQKLKNWSERKLAIMTKYLDGFMRILGSRFRGSIYYIDGFSGKGVYDDGKMGSPVLAAELALGHSESNNQSNLICINVEKDLDCFTNLQQATKKFGNIVHNINGLFEEKLSTVLDITGDSPAFFFIDDFGVKGAGWDSVQLLISRKAPTDLWIRFDYKTLRRLAGSVNSSAAAASKKFSLIPKVFGIDDPQYLLSRLSGNTAEERIQNALDLYLERLEKTYSQYHDNEGYAAAYPIFSLEEERKYFLIFAGAHPKAAILASDIVFGEEQNYQRELQEYKEQSDNQLNFLPLVDPTEIELMTQKVNRIKNVILAQFRGMTIKRILLHYQILRLDHKKWFGKIASKHINRALKELMGEGKVKLIGVPSSDETIVQVL